MLVHHDTHVLDEVHGLAEEERDALLGDGERVDVHDNGLHAEQLLGGDVRLVGLEVGQVGLPFRGVAQQVFFGVVVEAEVRAAQERVDVFVQ